MDDLSFISKPFVYKIDLREEFTYKRPIIEGTVKKIIESKTKTVIIISDKKIIEHELTTKSYISNFCDVMCKIPVFIIEEEVKK